MSESHRLVGALSGNRTSSTVNPIVDVDFPLRNEKKWACIILRNNTAIITEKFFYRSHGNYDRRVFDFLLSYWLHAPSHPPMPCPDLFLYNIINDTEFD